MIIYNVTTRVDHTILEQWLQWQRQVHIPEVMATGFFTGHRFYKLLEQDEEDGQTFVTQYIAASREEVDRYLSQSAAELRKKAAEAWGHQAVSFRTLLQEVH